MSISANLIGIAALILLSAFFSASEMAITSANRLRIENAMESGTFGAKAAFSVLSRFDDALPAILIGNNLVNIGAGSAATVLAILTLGESYAALFSGAATVLIIIFGETLPKIVAKKNANRITLAVSGILSALIFILKPVVLLTRLIIRAVVRPGGETPDAESKASELVSIIETVEDEGVIDMECSELLQAALDFSEVSALEAMTSRVDIDAIDAGDTPDEIGAAIANSGYSRIPVYEDSPDNIIGVLNVNRYYKARLGGEVTDIRALLMEPCYVYKTRKLPDVLTELRRSKIHLAIVTDDYGGTMGIITMEDVLEQIVGEIYDEKDEIVAELTEREPGVYEVSGDMGIYELLEFLEIDEAGFEAESSTVGGWTLENFGAYPKAGDTFTDGDNALEVTVLAMDGLRVESVLIKKLAES